MSMFVREAGWGIWPILFFGFFGLVVATRYARRPSRERLSLVVGLAIATVLMGILGTVVGVQTTAVATYLARSDVPSQIFLVGLSESLNNMVAALLFATFHTLIGTYGTHRLARLRGVPSIATEAE